MYSQYLRCTRLPKIRLAQTIILLLSALSEGLKKWVKFNLELSPKLGGAGPGVLNLCEILVAIVFGLKNPTFLANSDIIIPKCTEGGVGESTDLGYIPKKTTFLRPSH